VSGYLISLSARKPHQPNLHCLVLALSHLIFCDGAVSVSILYFLSKLRDTSSEFLFPGRPAIANNKVSSLLEDQDLQSAHFRTGVTSGRPLWSSCCAKPSLLASFSSAWITVLVLAHLLLLDLLPNAHRRLNESISLMYRTTSALMIGAHG
jgi:hypothetical protein